MPKKKKSDIPDQKLEKAMSTIALASTVRNIVIHHITKKLAETNLNESEKKQAIADYRSSILKQWNQINAANAKPILDQYDKSYYPSIIDWIKNDNKAWLIDAEPFITKFDIEKCCNELGLNPSDFYKSCMELKHATPWLQNLQLSINKMFRSNYPQQLHHKLTQWIIAAK